VLLGVVNSLANGLGHLTGLAQAGATRPAPSPTTTRALKEKRRPPFTTLATRFRLTTRSVSSPRASRSGRDMFMLI